MNFMAQARIRLPMEAKEELGIEKHTRFTIWDGDTPTGEYIVSIFEMISEIYYTIEEIIPHSEDGVNLDYEETRAIFDGFCKEHTEEIIRLVATGEDGYVQGRYIKVLTPSFPLPKDWNPKYVECHKMLMNEGEFEEKVLNVIGEADYKTIARAIANRQEVTYRYLYEHHYKDSFRDETSGTSYCQIFIDGENAGYCEDHPQREYYTCDCGKFTNTHDKTIYHDLLLCSVGGYSLVHRKGSVHIWIKKSE